MTPHPGSTNRVGTVEDLQLWLDHAHAELNGLEDDLSIERAKADRYRRVLAHIAACNSGVWGLMANEAINPPEERKP